LFTVSLGSGDYCGHDALGRVALGVPQDAEASSFRESLANSRGDRGKGDGFRKRAQPILYGPNTFGPDYTGDLGADAGVGGDVRGVA
jgi:hypothetical protein